MAEFVLLHTFPDGTKVWGSDQGTTEATGPGDPGHTESTTMQKMPVAVRAEASFQMVIAVRVPRPERDPLSPETTAWLLEPRGMIAEMLMSAEEWALPIDDASYGRRIHRWLIWTGYSKRHRLWCVAAEALRPEAEPDRGRRMRR